MLLLKTLITMLSCQNMISKFYENTQEWLTFYNPLDTINRNETLSKFICLEMKLYYKMKLYQLFA